MSELDNLITKLKAHPYTTCLGAIAGICQALATIDQLGEYKTVLLGISGLATVLFGYFATDKVDQ